jgi:two-component system, NtrC family, nitrogen regulation sensor histidine kinase GlnL
MNAEPARDIKEGVMALTTPQQLFDHLSTAVICLDPNLALQAINPAGESLFRVSAKKFIGQPLSQLLPGDTTLQSILKQTLVDKSSYTARGISLHLTASQELTVDCTVTPIIEGAGVRSLVIELAQVDRLMRLARDESAHDRHQANRAILRGLAHEIKNPLGGLRGAAQLLEKELTDKDLREFTRIIIHEADRLRNLVDRMIGAYRPLTKKFLNIHEILEHVRKLVQVELTPELRIQRDYDPSLPVVRADADQLIQAILNIVRNAVEALDDRGVITLRTRIERNFTIAHKLHRLVLRIDIEDNGPGVAPEMIDQIFYPMVTGRATGTGLGLSIAQDIIAKHGGMIACVSTPGDTRFTLYLPPGNEHG